jgi:signal peptidase II
MASRLAPKTLFFFVPLLISLPLDQLTKQIVVAKFYYGERLPVIEGLFDLTYVRNPGGAFSFFADGSFEHRMLFFVGTTIIAIGLLCVFFWRLEPQARLSACALGAILGGALGNLIDRLVHGEVIDFIDVHLWGGYTWPTFNVADACIVVGVAILITETFFEERSARAAQKESETREAT